MVFVKFSDTFQAYVFRVNKYYVEIDENLCWENVLPKLDQNDIFLLNKGEGDFILAWGARASLTLNVNKYDADSVQTFLDKHTNNYIFSYISYDVKNNETRTLSKQKTQSSAIHFIVAEHVFFSKKKSNFYFGELGRIAVHEILSKITSKNSEVKKSDKISLTPNTSRDSYIAAINGIKTKIQAGIIYEMNFCIDFESTFDQMNPAETYLKLVQKSNAPFSTFVKHGKQFILSASPERFLLKKGNVLISQPIKGTARRGKNSKEDQEIKLALQQDQKEISENVMIVDLVRNDLSKLAEKNSVNVHELCKLYSFETVHQLISTVSCNLKSITNFTSILQALFPMGSMTGAPKISAIEQINAFENFQRGIYSGCVGFIEPNGNFDFNVIIRTILIDEYAKTINCRVGGAITIHSIPENEYQECLLKLKVLQSSLC